jgi:hypothetical protein
MPYGIWSKRPAWVPASGAVGCLVIGNRRCFHQLPVRSASLDSKARLVELTSNNSTNSIYKNERKDYVWHCD